MKNRFYTFGGRVWKCTGVLHGKLLLMLFTNSDINVMVSPAQPGLMMLGYSPVCSPLNLMTR